jgi:hypothetical protein
MLGSPMMFFHLSLHLSLVRCPSYNHLSKFLAHASSWRAKTARTIPRVGDSRCNAIDGASHRSFSGCKMTMRRSLSILNLTSNCGGYLIWALFILRLSCRIVLWKQKRHHWRRPSSSYFQRKVIRVIIGWYIFMPMTIRSPDAWNVDELIPRLGSVDLAPTVKALNMWADKGVLVEETEACYKLLEVTDTNARAPVQRPRG